MAGTSALNVALVSVEREVWQGEAVEVIARTTEGEIGILPGHAALLGQLAEGFTVTVKQSGGQDVVAAVHGGFLSVADSQVTVLAEIAELSTDIDTARAQAALQRAQSDKDEPAARRAEARLRATGAQV